ncbi:hypothetical protein [Catellatospora chokoriensis]|uniref:Uncharacterized protein n=1 Tax=Catellatospora chokoriensis TaxID=310353 RepID=A0A8J3KAN0_9ACTN|nr:hypothetical protein [Catellatospora chokoriensis]GIF91644.1 hypothetical protein Cch02nite_50880 [Catellatospora chokoriensis]
MRRLSTARPGRAARVLVLLATLVGLAAMHTLGHGGAAHAAMTPMPGHETATAAEATAAGMAAAVAMTAAQVQAGAATAAQVEAVPQEGCPDGHCAGLLAPPARHSAGMDWWDVCVAVLTALGVLLLLCWLVGVVSRRGSGTPSQARAVAASRGPPVRGLGLTLATVSVMRH